MPVAVVVALQSNMNDDWRHMYFLWGPFSLLAAVGLHHITNIRMGGGIWKIGARLPGWVRGGRLHMAQRALAYGVAGFGLITTLTAMAALHPHQQVYFNALVDTKTPGALAKRYMMDYWEVAQLQALEYLLARYPDATLRVWPEKISALILPKNDRERITNLSPHAADFYLWIPKMDYYPMPAPKPQKAGFYHPLIDPRNISEQSPIHSVKAYGNAIARVYPKDTDAYLAAYEDIAANGDPLARADFDIYTYENALYYLSADCLPPAPNRAEPRFFLHLFPADLADLPADSREFGFENRDFWLNTHAAFFDGKCVNRQLLPDYPIARISTGVYLEGKAVWRADVNLVARAAAQDAHDGIAAGDYGQPIAQSDFDLYLSGNALTYIKESCAPGDTDARFFLHIFPANPADLPVDRRENGFANMDFRLGERGAYAGDKCVAERDLPDYAIERIRTGQFASGEGSIWRAEFPAAR